MNQPDYIGKDGVSYHAYNTLTQEREDELKRHLSSCESSLQQCDECWLLYVSIGHDEYTACLVIGCD